MEKYLERKWKVIPQWKTEKQQQQDLTVQRQQGDKTT
uniref:Uncharacterized protein n=1 Tax=Arundo donax TaxID=35708 RepID=A0A0A8Y6P5_ARUDO